LPSRSAKGYPKTLTHAGLSFIRIPFVSNMQKRLMELMKNRLTKSAEKVFFINICFSKYPNLNPGSPKKFQLLNLIKILPGKASGRNHLKVFLAKTIFIFKMENFEKQQIRRMQQTILSC
jgi:hypothetical protein